MPQASFFGLDQLILILQHVCRDSPPPVSHCRFRMVGMALRVELKGLAACCLG